MVELFRWWRFKRKVARCCNVSGCRETKVELYTYDASAFGGLAVTKRLVALCRRHVAMVRDATGADHV